MKTRESGMPPEELWEEFFDADQVLKKLRLTEHCGNVLDLGCGYGTFAIPAAKIVQGVVYALDIEAEMLAIAKTRADAARLRNIEFRQQDFAAEGSGLPEASVDYVMLFNILHAEERMILLQEAWRVLCVGGRLAVIHWNYDPTTPRGPRMNIRPRPGECC